MARPLHVSNQTSPSPHLLHGSSALGRKSPDGLGQLPELPPMDGLLCDGRISAVSLYGMRMNSKTCKKKKKKRKKNVLEICLKRLVFCSCVVLDHFHYVWVGFLFVFFLFFCFVVVVSPF